MDKVRLILTVISIVIVVVPIMGVVLMNQGNLLGLVIPPEVNKIADNFMSGRGFSIPQMEPLGEPQYDEFSRTVTMTYKFSNTSPYPISIDSISGDVECAEHSFHLGTVTLDKPVSIDAGETKTLTLLGTWTEAAISHFQSSHAGEKTVDAKLVGFTVNVKGFQIRMDQNTEIPNPTA